mmetsp:Transcript_9576/g.15903  ORF Transcript_9576/g.15903 Transcript_9576/m.15903 type:complete len:264 (+) Transcript_9576:441-1232(+)
MARLEHLQEGETAAALFGRRSTYFATLHLLCFRDVVFVIPAGIRFVIEALLARPGKVHSPGLVADPVADEVDIPGVDEHSNAPLQHGLQHLLVVVHPVAGELHVHGVVAALPGLHLIAHAERAAGGVEVEVGLDVGEVVAEIALTAGHADVVRVEARLVVRGRLHEVAVVVGRHAGILVELAGLSHLYAGGHVVHHLAVGLLRHALDVVGVVHGHLRIVLVLNDRIRKTVTHTHTRQIYMDSFLVVIALEDARSNGWSIMATI